MVKGDMSWDGVVCGSPGMSVIALAWLVLIGLSQALACYGVNMPRVAQYRVIWLYFVALCDVDSHNNVCGTS